MIQRLFLAGFAVIFCMVSYAQNFTISGLVRDHEAQLPLPGTTIRLTSATDTTFSMLFATDSSGRFSIPGLPRDSFNLVFSYVGYHEVFRGIRIDSTNLGFTIGMVPRTSGELATIVITATPPAVVQRGDTVQFNASQYKVNPDASAEELVRKIPGITIEDGQVMAQGENVQKVTIDGRELFGDDATAALRNLPAEIIDKIQVFDRLSDQAQFTGFDDGNTTKSINIITKADMRNGQFGRIYAGYGTDNRYAAGGNATILRENRRISIAANFNNINQQNFSQLDLLGVTSNAQRGGGGGGPRGGGGNPRGGSGNRGPAGGGGNRGGGNFGGFGSNANFLVGQQNGINRTNSLGINFSDIWGSRVTVSGSYFFNNNTNTTNELSATEFFPNAESEILNIFDSTLSEGTNNNHRVTMRLEYRIDSANQLIITPNLAFQSNNSDRTVGSAQFYAAGGALAQSINRNSTSSSRTGNNLNNTILYRRTLAKRGRTFSVNLNTSYNRRQSDVFVSTMQRNIDSIGAFEDTTSNRFADQLSNGWQVSTNIVYTEPLGENSQVQINYNPSVSVSESDQLAYEFDPLTGHYSEFLQNFSNTFENRTIMQNGGVSYRYNKDPLQFSIGASVQQTRLQSERIFPLNTTVNKTFLNLLPNAMMRITLSQRSNLRLFYRSNVNQPSVTQLQDVLDPTNAPFFTMGNPDLDPQFMHRMSARYTFTNSPRSILFVGNLFYLTASRYIANATFNSTRDTIINGQLLTAGYRLTQPVNLDGYHYLRSFLTFAIPLRFIKTNLNVNGGVSFRTLPGMLNGQPTESRNTTYSMGTVLASNISEQIDFTVSYSANFNDIYTRQRNTSSTSGYFQHIASVQLNLLSKSGWLFQNELNNQYFSGLTEGFNQNYWLWNMSAGKKFLKDRKGEIRISVFDLLEQNRSIIRNVTESYIEDVQNQVLRQYFMLTFTYNLRNFGTPAARRAASRP